MKKTLIASAAMVSATYAKSKMASVDVSSLTKDLGFSIVGTGVTGATGLGYTVSSAGDYNKDSHEDILITTSTEKAYVVFGTGVARTAVLYDLADSAKTTTDFITISAPAGSTNLVGAAAGDLNGDGADDIVIGVPGTAGAAAGVAYVVYGKATPANVDLTTTLTTNSVGFKFTNAASNSNFGSAIAAAGDVNGDNIDDLVISAPNDDGIVYVIRGTSASRSADVDLSTLAAADGFKITPASASTAKFGTSLAGIGDVNGDTYDDILVGAPGSDAAYIVYGMATANIADITDVSAAGNAAKVAKITGTASSGLGQTVALAGDFNAAGKNDLIVASPNSGAGTAYVLFGESLTIDTTTKDVADITLSSLGTAGITITGATTGDKLGYAIAGVDDVNDDNLDDIVLTSYGAGKAYVLFGAKDIASINLASTLDSQDGVTITGTTASGFGKSVAALGDITGDDIDDFVISAPTYDYKVDSTTTRTGAGAAYIVYGVENSAFRLGAGISLIVSFFAALMI